MKLTLSFSTCSPHNLKADLPDPVSDRYSFAKSKLKGTPLKKVAPSKTNLAIIFILHFRQS